MGTDMPGTIQDRLHAFRERSLEYVRLGHDRLAAARFVAEAAGPLRGPALDIGTGKGLLAIALARRGLEVFTLDVDAQEQELAGLLAEEAGVAGRITFAHHDAACLPYADGQFGCVAMMDVLHHLAEPLPVLREMVRVLHARGTILIADFDEPGFEIVSRIHRAEGHEHQRAAATVSLATEELIAMGLRAVSRSSGHQHEVVVLSKGEQKPVGRSG
jgi:ubiquinone/menaquinone biosynthesis C-methylase UbiE